MKVAIVILNWNGIAFLKQFLPVLFANTDYVEAEIIVADNASTDGSVDYLFKTYPKLRVIILEKNYGFAGGYNKALEQIQAKYYVLLNSDVEVTPGWLNPMIDYLETHNEVVACQPKIKAFHTRNFFEHAGASGGFIDYLGFPFCRGRVLGTAEEDRGQYNEVCDVFWATGACLVIRSEIFWKAGAFDETFFAHMEEIDLCWRLKARGHRIVCVPESAVYHVGGGTLNVESPYKTYLNFRNNLLMLYKNLPQQSLERILKRRRILDYLAAFQLFITGKRKNAAAVFRARRDFVKMKPKYFDKRNENLLFATRTNCNEMIKKSIIVAYYLKNKKKFSEIVTLNKQIEK